jgi:hypothetical protein
LDASAWQPASEELFVSGRKMETLLASVLGVSATAAGEDSTSQLLTALAQFSAHSEYYLGLVQ